MKSISLLFVLVLFITSCSHINELKKYDLGGKTILFEQAVNPNFSNVEIDFGSSLDDKKDKNIIDGITDLVNRPMCFLIIWM